MHIETSDIPPFFFLQVMHYGNNTHSNNRYLVTKRKVRAGEVVLAADCYGLTSANSGTTNACNINVDEEGKEYQRLRKFLKKEAKLHKQNTQRGYSSLSQSAPETLRSGVGAGAGGAGLGVDQGGNVGGNVGTNSLDAEIMTLALTVLIRRRAEINGSEAVELEEARGGHHTTEEVRGLLAPLTYNHIQSLQWKTHTDGDTSADECDTTQTSCVVHSARMVLAALGGSRQNEGNIRFTQEESGRDEKRQAFTQV
jgi:hypothetical protein